MALAARFVASLLAPYAAPPPSSQQTSQPPSNPPPLLPKLFTEFDVDSSDALDKREFAALVASLEKKMGKIGVGSLYA